MFSDVLENVINLNLSILRRNTCMKNPNTVPELLQSFQTNFKNFKIFKHALFVNYALIPRIIT
jgi:hypothetical protein